MAKQSEAQMPWAAMERVSTSIAWLFLARNGWREGDLDVVAVFATLVE